jgi:hypothetical protein
VYPSKIADFTSPPYRSQHLHGRPTPGLALQPRMPT